MNDEWGTPDNVFNHLNEEFQFTLDAAATAENAKCEYFLERTDENDEGGLSKPWVIPDGDGTVVSQSVVFMNPPYSKPNIPKWCQKAVTEVAIGNAKVVVALLPAGTDTQWWHDWVEHFGTPGRKLRGVLVEHRFLEGRVQFVKPGPGDETLPGRKLRGVLVERVQFVKPGPGDLPGSTFASVVVIWRKGDNIASEGEDDDQYPSFTDPDWIVVGVHINPVTNKPYTEGQLAHMRRRKGA